jgi:hypothetical protein
MGETGGARFIFARALLSLLLLRSAIPKNRMLIKSFCHMAMDTICRGVANEEKAVSFVRKKPTGVSIIFLTKRPGGGEVSSLQVAAGVFVGDEVTSLRILVGRAGQGALRIPRVAQFVVPPSGGSDALRAKHHVCVFRTCQERGRCIPFRLSVRLGSSIGRAVDS